MATATVTTSFTVKASRLDRVRACARRRGISVTNVITQSLQAELMADEILDVTANGRSKIGSGWNRPILVPRYQPRPTDEACSRCPAGR